jgi:hypothetical protein
VSIISDGKGLRGGEGAGADGNRLKDDPAICFKHGACSNFMVIRSAWIRRNAKKL